MRLIIKENYAQLSDWAANYVANRIKAANEGIYYNVDALYAAIAENCRVSFWYCEWGTDRRLRRRRARRQPAGRA